MQAKDGDPRLHRPEHEHQVQRQCDHALGQGASASTSPAWSKSHGYRISNQVHRGSYLTESTEEQRRATFSRFGDAITSEDPLITDWECLLTMKLDAKEFQRFERCRQGRRIPT